MTIKLAASAIALLFMVVALPTTTPPHTFGQDSPVAASNQLRKIELQTISRGFVAEPEDPTEVELIAELENPELVCFLQVNGPIDVCRRGEKPARLVIPQYDRVP